MSDELTAFCSANFNYVRSLESVWVDSQSDVEDVNKQTVDAVLGEFWRQTTEPTDHAIGQVALGSAGIGKTHLVSQMRKRVWQQGGWFVLLDIIGLQDFWTSTALSFAGALQQKMPSGDIQGVAVLRSFAHSYKVEKQVMAALENPSVDQVPIVNILIDRLWREYRGAFQQHQDVFRALYLFCSADFEASNLAYAWLQGLSVDETKSSLLGFASPRCAPVDLVRGLSWVMSLTGPTLVAVDQIDGLINPSSFVVSPSGSDGESSQPPLVEILTAGLMELHDKRRRGMTVVTCLEGTWEILKERSLHSAMQRFAAPRELANVQEPSVVGRLIATRLNPTYAKLEFQPPFPTWPFTPKAINSAIGLLPRQILMRCENHRRMCAEVGQVSLCDSLAENVKPTAVPVQPTIQKSELGVEFQKQQSSAFATISDLLDEVNDEKFGQLLCETLDHYIEQFVTDEYLDLENLGDTAQRKPPLHGRLTFTFHDQHDRQAHYCFRAIEHSNAVAFQSRLKAALTAAGISQHIPDRHLFLVRRAPVPSGPKTKQLFTDFQKAGGVLISPIDSDLCGFLALKVMNEKATLSSKRDAFESWLRAEKPLLETDFFKRAGLSPPMPRLQGDRTATGTKNLDALPLTPNDTTTPQLNFPAAVLNQEKTGTQPAPTVPLPPTGSSHPQPSMSPPHTIEAIPVGRYIAVGDKPAIVPFKLLPRHIAIIAGSGSGKTVLLRRIVEEAALAGIPAIVIDPNNDLSRLGDPWPARPDTFTAEDAAKAERYFKQVDVVVWTPGVHAGNPIFLPVMPDFTSLGDDRDERQQAVDMAAETLGPLANAKNALQRGVLVEALRHFASKGGNDLDSFTDLLSDLPEGLSPIKNAAKLAAGMADQLHAAVATNPLLKAEGPVLDPRLLFFHPNSKQTRISVINLSGLTSDQAREDFVNRLQMSLFGWIKKNPSTTGLLYVIDEAQNFLPAGKQTLSLGSGVKLVAQARKYGLGMIVATQAPRGIYNQVVSNCTTQFFGKQNAPATIGAAQEIIEASGGRADDIGKLKTGEFYFATEGSQKPAKIRTPICLSYHPANPPSPDEVIERAKRSRLRS